MARAPALCSFGPKIRLVVDGTEGEAEKPVWIQICAEGKFRGHPMNVEFSRAFFSTVVANFRRNPSFKAGGDGLGSEPVVPFDYEHASEMPVTSGTIPQTGSPAPAWALDLAIRDGADGKAELWALAKLGPKIREQIRAGEYRWTSVAIAPHMKDAKTGEDIGPVLTSVAFTNQPFVKGMQPIAASMSVWGTAETPEEAVVGLREIFGLPGDALAVLVLTELEQFASMLVSGVLPEGIDAEAIVGRMRSLLGLRTLATRDEIFAEAGRVLSGLISGGSQLPNGSPVEAAHMNGTENQLTARLAALFGIAEKDPTLVGGAILAAAQKAQESGNALDKLKSLFGSSDVQAILADAASLVAQSKQLEGLVVALSDAMKALTGSADPNPDNEKQAAAAMASIKPAPTGALAKLLGPIMLLAVATVREHALADAEAEAVVNETAKKDKDLAERLRPIIVDARRACMGNPGKLAEFRQRFPLPDETRSYLASRVLAGPNGQQLGGPATGAPPAPAVPTTAPLTATAPAAGGAPTPFEAELGKHEGRNRTEKAIALLSSRDASFSKLPWVDQCRRAGKFLQAGTL